MLLASLLAMILVAMTAPAFPALLTHITGRFESHSVDNIGYLALLVLVVFAVRGVTQFISRITLEWITLQLVMELRNLLVHTLMHLPIAFYDQNNPGKIASRVLYEPGESIECTAKVFNILVRDSLTILFLFGWMLYIEWQLTLIVIAIAPVVMVVVRYFSQRLRRMSQGAQETRGELTRVLYEVLDGYKVVRTYGAHDYEIDRFAQTTRRLRRFDFKFAVAATASAPIAQFVAAIALALIVFIVGQRIADNSIRVDYFIGFSTAMVMLFAPIKSLTSINAILQRGIAAIERVFALVDEAPEQDDGTQSIERSQGRLSFEQVYFGYSGQDQSVLHSINLEINPGETIALVGPSGGGKSTLAALIPRFYDVGSGCIRLDGIDIRDLKLASLRENIALVSQDIVLFDDTITANIAYGRLQPVDRRQIKLATDAACATGFIADLADGVDTVIGAHGVRLSGGQRQRLAIARAFIKDAPILILDEATSALDNESERYIQTALANLRQGRTTIVIAHRLSTIESADRIVVVDQGRIVDIGAHAALLRRSGLYASLYRLEFSRDASPPPAFPDVDRAALSRGD